MDISVFMIIITNITAKKKKKTQTKSKTLMIVYPWRFQMKNKIFII